LLHVTLEELWRGGSLTLSAYGETTLATAIQRRADTVLQYRDYDGARSQERPTEQQQLLLDLFTDLVKVPLDGEELDITRVVRRRLPFDEVSKGSQERQFLIDELSHARLLSKDTQRTTETEYVEVTVIHDALIREWSTLRVRIAEHAEELRKVERFRVALQEWVNSGKTKHYLLTGGRLAEAEVLQREDATVLRNPDAEAFLAASIKKRKGDQRTRFVVSLLLVLLVIGIGGAGWVAWEQQQLAAQEAEERERQQEIALSRELAAQSVSLQDTDPRLTLLLAMQSDNIISTAETRSSLLDALQATPVRASLVGHLDEVRSVAFSPDGQTLASGSWDATVLLWDVTSGESISEPLEGHMDVVNSVAFSPDGQTLASGSWDEAGNTVLLWDLTTEPPERTSLSGHPDGVYTNAVFDVAFSPDGTLLAVGRQEKTILLWDVASRQPSNMFSVHTGRVHDVAFSPDGQTLASASEDTTIVLQSVGTGSVDIVLIGHSGEVYNVAFSPDGQTLVSSSEDNTVRLWDVATGEQMHIFSGHADAVMSIAFSPDGQTLVSGGLDGNILLWDMARGPSIGEPLEGHTDMVNGIVFSPNGQTLASGSSDTTILLWDVSIGQPISDPLEGHTSQVSSVAFSPDGQILASGSLDRTIILWDVESGQLLGDPLNGHTDAVMSIAFSPDGQTLVSGGLDGTVCLWDVATGQQINQLLAEHTSSIYSMVFSADGQTLALGKGDGTVYLWDVATQQQLGPQLEGHADHITSMAFSPDGQFLASGGCVERSSDGACVVGDIRLWSVETGQQIGEPLTENTVAISMAFSPDGQTLAAGNQDRTIRLWDVATGQPLGTRLARHTGWVSSVVFSSSGQILASGSVDGTVHLWDIPVTDSKARACRAAGRNLTWEEWQRYLPDRPYELTCPDLPPHPSAVEAGMWEE
jgi:WD40 repeat protein